MNEHPVLFPEPLKNTHNRRASAWQMFLAYWVTHGPALVAGAVLMSTIDPPHARIYNALAVLAASLMGGHAPAPLLNGEGIGALLSSSLNTNVKTREDDNATHSS